MTKGAVEVLCFVAGMAIGVAGSWKFFEKKYSDIADEEIRSVKEAYSKVDNKENTEPANDLPTFSKSDIDDYASIASSYSEEADRPDYTVYSSASKSDDSDDPYVITPEEFGEFEDYEKIELTYYSNEILTDDRGEIVDDPDRYIGKDALTHFGEYEDDSVFVRNDRVKCDYQILLEPKEFMEGV